MHARRAASTLPHPVEGLRQTLLALLGGAELGEHESPGPASLVVLRGRVRLIAGEDTVELGAQQFSPVPDRRHSLHADEDSVVLLSIAVPSRLPWRTDAPTAPPKPRSGATVRTSWCPDAHHHDQRTLGASGTDQPTPRSRAMSIRCTSLVPSPISRIFASR